MKIITTNSYFSFTTLCTIGLGDYVPVSNEERALAVIVFLGGVSIFSYIMSQL